MFSSGRSQNHDDNCQPFPLQASWFTWPAEDKLLTPHPSWKVRGSNETGSPHKCVCVSEQARLKIVSCWSSVVTLAEKSTCIFSHNLSFLWLWITVTNSARIQFNADEELRQSFSWFTVYNQNVLLFYVILWRFCHLSTCVRRSGDFCVS